MVGSTTKRIIRYLECSTASATGTLEYECDDGSIWHDCEPFEPRQGVRMDDVVIPDIGSQYA
jgi:hypothetical protein